MSDKMVANILFTLASGLICMYMLVLQNTLLKNDLFSGVIVGFGLMFFAVLVVWKWMEK